MKSHDRSARVLGQRVATVLSGSWRNVPQAVDPTSLDGAERVADLRKPGGGGPGWWRARPPNLQHSTSSERLRNAFRLQALGASLHEQRIAAVVEYCKAAGIEPLFAK